MPSANEPDPLRGTDRDDGVATPGADVTAGFTPASPPDHGETAAYPRGRAADAGIPASASVPGYEVQSVLGRGGMGVVYKARDLTLKRPVALKMILARGHAGPEELARFRTEAEAVARLQHPNIVQIYEVGEADGHPYCALEFVEGGNLTDRLGGKPMPAREAAGLVEALARAMQLAHSRNVVHRDLKPANILLTADGTPKITDFGLARQLDNDSGETQAGAVLGTPSYMAPEQAAGSSHEAGPAADVYALGAILYDCLAGRPPFKGRSVVETLDQVRTQEPVPPSRRQASIPPDLEAVCLKCLEKDPGHRYASAQQLADDLGRWGKGEPTRARPWSWRRRLGRGLRRHWKLSAAALFVMLTVVTFLFTFVWSSPEYQARQALRRVDDAVKSAERVELIGRVGPPKWSRQVFAPLASRLSSDKSGVFQVDASSTALVELAPAAHHDRYRLSAEVRMLSSNKGDSGAGLYFAHNTATAGPAGCVERLLVARFNRNRSAHKEMTDRVNLVQLFLLSRDGKTKLDFPTAQGVHSYNIGYPVMEEPWRYLEAVVTPQAVRASWREQDGTLHLIGIRDRVRKTVKPVPVESLHPIPAGQSKFLHEKYGDVPWRTEYQPRGALGLFVSQGVAEFRNVVYEPVPEEPAP